MHTCPWCGRRNLNVYAYCQGCGRGFAGPEAVGESSMFVAPHLNEWFSAGLPARPGAASAFWPVALALAALTLGGAWLLAGTNTARDFAVPLLSASGTVALFLLTGWWLARRSPERTAAPSLPRRFTQVLTVTGTGATSRAAVLESLGRLPGVLTVSASRGTGEAAAFGLCLGDEVALPGDEAIEAAVRGVVGEGTGVVVFPRQAEGRANAPRVRMGVWPAVTLIAAALILGLTVAAFVESIA